MFVCVMRIMIKRCMLSGKTASIDIDYKFQQTSKLRRKNKLTFGFIEVFVIIVIFEVFVMYV